VQAMDEGLLHVVEHVQQADVVHVAEAGAAVGQGTERSLARGLDAQAGVGAEEVLAAQERVGDLAARAARALDADAVADVDKVAPAYPAASACDRPAKGDSP
jgi:hypothetical protein